MEETGVGCLGVVFNELGEKMGKEGWIETCESLCLGLLGLGFFFFVGLSIEVKYAMRNRLW